MRRKGRRGGGQEGKVKVRGRGEKPGEGSGGKVWARLRIEESLELGALNGSQSKRVWAVSLFSAIKLQRNLICQYLLLQIWFLGKLRKHIFMTPEL